MIDRIEIEYHIGEFRAHIARYEEVLPSWYEAERNLKAQKKEIEEELSAVKNKLADARTHIADYEEAKAKLEDSIRKLEAWKDKLLSEPEAVATLKKVRDSGKFQDNCYRTESKSDADRFFKALTTIDADADEPKPSKDESGDWIVEVVTIPDSYREFLYGFEECR